MELEHVMTPLPRRRRWLAAAQRATWSTRLAHLYNGIARPSGAVVLMYHSVCADDSLEPWIDPRNRISAVEFERQMAFLGAHRRPASLADLLRAAAEGRDLPRGSVVVTFDDGYRDNLEVAAPILERHGVPATLYLATGWVDRGEAPWSDRLYACFSRRTSDRLVPPLVEGERLLADDAAAGRAYLDLASSLITADRERREEVLELATRQLRGDTDGAPRLTLVWDEVRRLRDTYPAFSLGLHTADHLDLTSLSETEVSAQLEGCRAAATRELGEAPVDFAYPYNREVPSLRARLGEHGFRSAVTSGTAPLVGRGLEPFAVPRIDAPADFTLFQLMTSGAHPGLSRLLFRRP